MDGLEALLLEKYSTSSTGHYNSNYNKHKVHLCRYADDFIVTADCREVLIEIKEVLVGFMDTRGLKLSEEKTVITNINDGFDFLGWNFRKFRGKLLIQPSTKSKKKVTEKLNEITKGWSEYHHCVCAKRAFALIDHRLWKMLWKWAKRKHPEVQSKWDKVFWARGYYVETIGNITDEAVQKYIKEQAEDSRKEDSRGTAL